ncbi:uncharacterized protein LOC135378273 isoform X1 [Ornithodoros turicata]|uniref:uncharacterized protein LOC135378273 isoform X1 n=1 Tax=Ornithodoros turicata TaxID=34597 RepID=UPI00313924F0
MGMPLDVFVKEPDNLPGFSYKVSLAFLNALGGVLTIAEILCGILTFALAYSGRSYHYELSHLVVKVEPSQDVTFMIIVSFLYWFVSALILASALVSNTGIHVTTTFFYLLFQAFGFVFYLCGGVSLMAMEKTQAVLIAAGVFAILSAVLHGCHSLLTYRRKE